VQKLIITNGDVAGDRLRALFPKVDILPWHDVLHEGPVPQTTSFSELSQIREDYLSNAFTSVDNKPQSKLRARDLVLQTHASFERVELWFEHDLYDQLQLLQALDFFNEVEHRAGVFLCQSDTYLGHLGDDQLAALAGVATHVPPETFEFAKTAWAAFRQPTPETWVKLALAAEVPLPHFTSAAIRMLEELPDSASGLSRSEHQILAHLENGPSRPGLLFGAYQQDEEAIFMGDWSFFRLLEHLTTCPVPLISGLGEVSFQMIESNEDRQNYLARELHITEAGIHALTGKLDHVVANCENRWWGAAHLTPDNDWRWDQVNQSLIAPNGSPVVI